MSDQPKRTALGLPDLPDQLNGRPNVEEMQEEYLIERIGNVMYAALQEMEYENARIK